MLFVVISTDTPDAKSLRRELLAEHLAWVTTVMERVRVAGPLRDAPDGDPCMSLFVLEAEDEAEVRDLLAQDPYCRGGVWSSLEVRPFTAAAGTWVGGAAWLRGGL